MSAKDDDTRKDWISRMAPTIDMPLPPLNTFYTEDKKALHHSQLAMLTVFVNNTLGDKLNGLEVESIDQMDDAIRKVVAPIWDFADDQTLTRGVTYTITQNHTNGKVKWLIVLSAHGLTSEIIID